MIKLFLNLNIRNKRFGQGLLIKNLDADKDKILFKAFKQLFRKSLYQIYIDIDGMKKLDADILSRKMTHYYFGNKGI